MATSKRQERRDYLERHFPKSSAEQGHAPGRFTERVCEYLSRPIPLEPSRPGARYVVVDALESNGNPLREIVRFRFRLADDPDESESPRYGGLDEPIMGSAAMYYFFFDSASSLEENIEEFSIFLSEHSRGTATTATASGRLKIVGMDAWQVWAVLTVLVVGVLGSTALIIQAVLRHAIGLSMAIAVISASLIGIVLVARAQIRPRAKKRCRAASDRDGFPLRLVG